MVKGISVSDELHKTINDRRLEMINERKADISMARATDELITKGWLYDTCMVDGCQKKYNHNYSSVVINDITIGSINLCQEHSKIFGIKYYNNDKNAKEEFDLENKLYELKNKEIKEEEVKKDYVKPLTGHKFHYKRKVKPE
jgi:hypothetical protein